MNWKPTLALVILIPIVDFLWIGLVGKNLYLQGLADIGRIENGAFRPVLAAAFAVYVLLALGITYFVVPKSPNLFAAALWGALFGLVVYGVYDMTNYSTLKSYPLHLTLIDMAWGTILCSLMSVAARWIDAVA